MVTHCVPGDQCFCNGRAASAGAEGAAPPPPTAIRAAQGLSEALAGTRAPAHQPPCTPLWSWGNITLMSAGKRWHLRQPCSPRTWSSVSASGTVCPLLLPPADGETKVAVGGRGCCPHGLLQSAQLLASAPTTRGSSQRRREKKAQSRLQTFPALAEPWGHSCPTARWEQDAAVLALAPPPCLGAQINSPPFLSLLARQEPAAAAGRGDAVLPGTCFFTSCFSSSKSSGPREAPAVGPR